MPKEKNVFKTKFNGRSRVVSNPGDREIVVRKARKVDGVLTIEDTKELFPLADYINSFADSVDINVLLKRFKAGDQTVVQMFTNKVDDDFHDLTNVPDNIHEAFDLIHKGQDLFNQLPVEKKELFNNNYEQFILSAGSDEWKGKLGLNEREIEKPDAKDSGNTESVKVENPA